MTTLLKIMDIKRHLPILVCCLSLAACGSGGTGAVNAAGAVPVAPIAQAANSAPTASVVAASAASTVINSAPTASAVMITDTNGGSVVVGDTLVGSYVYADADGDAEGTSTFGWLRNGGVIPGAVAAQYIIVAADLGANISFEVTPVAATGVITGQLTSSPGVIVTNVTNKITQFGITWTFSQNLVHGQTYGQFANGDYWVLGPVTITNIFPFSTVDATGRTVNGSMINPSPRSGSIQGYDSSMYGGFGPFFNAALNVARPNQQDISAVNPLVVRPNSSMVSTISQPAPGVKPQIKSAAILTVLAVVPRVGSFRPPYSGVDKSIKYNKSQLNYFLLKQLAPVAGTPSMTTAERYFERPWIDHVPGWLGDDYCRVTDNMPGYSRGMATQIGIGTLMLNLNFTNAEKETLLIRIVQLGLDYYGITQDGGNNNWQPDGGEASGRKWPIMFAGLMLNDFAMQNIGPGDGTGPVAFGEDAQTFYVTQADINLVHNYYDSTIATINYVQADLGMVEWGIRHTTDPVIDNKNWVSNYRRCCTANAWGGEVLSARIMNAQGLWAHNALFDYQDLYMAKQKGLPAGNQWMRSWDTTMFTANMWDTYRVSY